MVSEPGRSLTVPLPGSGTFVGPDDDPDAYQLVELIGAGGEAEVWRAVTRPDPASPAGIAVAVKVYTLDLPDVADRDWVRRVQAMRHVHHPGLAVVHSAFVGAAMHPRTWATHVAERCRYLVMELVDGPSLQEWTQEHPGAGLRDRLRLLSTLAAALDALHAGRDGVPPVAHGDVKPDNVRIAPVGGAKLVDLGMMRLQGTTRLGPAMSSLPYAAPELFVAGEHAMPTLETDRFSFAATVFEVLTGVVPPLRDDHCGPDPSAMLPILERSPLTAGRPDVAAIVMAGLAADPSARPGRLVPWLAGARRTTGIVAPAGGVAPVPTGPGAGAGAASPSPAEAATRPVLGAVAAGPLPAADGWERPLLATPRRKAAPALAVAVAVAVAVVAVAVAVVAGVWILVTRLPGVVAADGGVRNSASGTSGTSAAAAAPPAGSGTPSQVATSTGATSGTDTSAGAATSAPKVVTASIPGGSRRTLATKEYLDVATGVVGTDVTGSDVQLFDEETLSFYYAKRVAIAPAPTDAAGCRAALAAREDDKVLLNISLLDDGKAVCLLTGDGRLAEVRVVSRDTLNESAVLEYRQF